MTVNLDTINFTQFPGGELHIKQEEMTWAEGDDTLFAPIRNSDDIMKLLLITDAYKRLMGEVFTLILPYIPYARQDRVANPGEALSIKVFADLINAQNYPVVVVMDPHSEVSLALINRVKVMHIVGDFFLDAVVPDYKDVVVIAPDAGAYKKLSKTISNVPLVYATKSRDTKTGRLSNCHIHSDIDLNGKRLLVVDDICDGGGTFIMLAEELKKQFSYESLELYVSHGIFSKGLEVLEPYFNKIYTTNSFYQGGTNEFVKVINAGL